MKVILQDVGRLDRLITDISYASRVDTEIIGQEGSRLDFVELVDNFIQLRRQSFVDKSWFTKPSESVMVVVQDSRIVQVLDNLLNNAVSFSPKGGEIIFELYTLEKSSEAALKYLLAALV